MRELIEEIAHGVDQPWCFLGDEGPGGRRRDADPRRVPRPEAGRKRSRG